MIHDPPCPVCDSVEWETIGKRTYHRTAMKSAGFSLQKRLQVLFEIWHPDAEQVQNRSLMCGRCGFVIYSPRPTADDLDRKYRYLGTLAPDPHPQPVTPAGEAERAQRLWKKMSRFVRRPEMRVLDFGGGDGRLVVPFAEHGCKCFVVDYAKQVVNEVTRLGTTLNDLSEHERFDVIVCSHVIEHVAEPRTTLEQLRKFLVPDGVIYVEVPMEIWRQPPLLIEPVTHVNFFTDQSMRVLLEQASYSEIDSRLEKYAHPTGRRAVVVSALARNAHTGETAVSYDRSVERTRSLLNPSWRDRISRALLDPAAVPQRLLHRFSSFRSSSSPSNRT